MSSDLIGQLVAALALPDSTRLNQRVPKKLLAQHGAATAADKRQIQEGVEDIIWLAALKPQLIGVPTFEDGQRQYVELAVLRLALKTGTAPGRLVELLHRAVPYPVLLFTTSDAGVGISLAHLRASQNEADKMVLDGELLSAVLPGDWAGGAALQAFLAAMALARQPQAHLHALYQGWADTLTALDIARETGTFQPSPTSAQAAERREALRQCRALQAKLQQLQVQAQRERQLTRLVALNREIQGLRTTLSAQSKRMLVAAPPCHIHGEQK